MPLLSEVLAANIRRERRAHDMTQETLADRMGWARTVVGQVEAPPGTTRRRSVTIDELPRLAKVFGVQVRDLLAGADPEDLAAFD